VNLNRELNKFERGKFLEIVACLELIAANYKIGWATRLLF
jgi:hypothetical protein